MSKAVQRRRVALCLVPLLQWCPEDLVYNVHRFLAGKDLAAASCVCREFYFSAFVASWAHFHLHFGKPPPTEPGIAVSRLRLFSLVDRVHQVTESNQRDLVLWAASRGYTKMVHTLAVCSENRLCEARQPNTGATPLILACEHGHLDVVMLLLTLVGLPVVSARCTHAGGAWRA
jgi:hypothetical protein